MAKRRVAADAWPRPPCSSAGDGCAGGKVLAVGGAGSASRIVRFAAIADEPRDLINVAAPREAPWPSPAFMRPGALEKLERGAWRRAHARTVLQRGIATEGGGEKNGLALRALGSTLMNKGKFAEATEAFDRCIAECGHVPLGACLERHGEEPQIVARQYKGLLLAVQGHTDGALAQVQAALSLAKNLNFPLIVAFTATILANVLLFRREGQAALRSPGADRTIAPSTASSSGRRRSRFFMAPLRAVSKATLRPLRKQRGASSTGERRGARLHVPTWSAFLAGIALVADDIVTAERALLDGIDTAQRNGDVFALAELERLTGRLRKRQNRRDEARRAFDRAVEIARAQDAGLYLLRAGRDLAQLLAEEGEAEGARDLLAPIVGGVTEHKTGLDYQELSALLASLAG